MQRSYDFLKRVKFGSHSNDITIYSRGLWDTQSYELSTANTHMHETVRHVSCSNSANGIRNHGALKWFVRLFLLVQRYMFFTESWPDQALNFLPL